MNLFKQNNNRLKKIFDYSFCNENYSQYVELTEQLSINTEAEVNYILELLKSLPNQDKYSRLFNPVEDILKYFNRNQEIKKNVLMHYFDHVLPLLKPIFYQISNVYTKGIILETLYCIGTTESITTLIELIADKDNDIDDYNSYNSIKYCVDLDKKMIDIFFKNSSKLLTNDGFRTVALVELFSQWALEDKIPYNPLKKRLDIIEKWISKKDYSKLSYAVSGCSALSTIKTKDSINLLKVASCHPKLEIQLEALFSLAVLGQDGVTEQFKKLALNPLISNHTLAYVHELKKLYEIDVDFTYKDIISSISNQEEFIAMSAMSEWCAHEREYGITPDDIYIWSKTEIALPHDQHKNKIYLIKYKYNNYLWEDKVQDIEHVGYYNSDTECVFSIMENFDHIDDAYSAYFDFEKNR